MTVKEVTSCAYILLAVSRILTRHRSGISLTDDIRSGLVLPLLRHSVAASTSPSVFFTDDVQRLKRKGGGLGLLRRLLEIEEANNEPEANHRN